MSQSVQELLAIAGARRESDPRDAAEHFFAASCITARPLYAAYAVALLEGLPEERVADVVARNNVLGGVCLPSFLTADSVHAELVRRGILPEGRSTG